VKLLSAATRSTMNANASPMANLAGSPAPHGAVVLDARGLALALGGRPVLQGISLELRAGQWAAIVGPNGAGKSTLLAALAGLVRPERGEVRLLGRALDEWPARRRAEQLAWLAQQGEAEGPITGADVVRLGRLPRHGLLGAPDAGDEAAVRAAMNETEATPFAARRLDALSGGERQRVLLARALAVQPRALLLDEPAIHLDAPHQRALLATLAREARRGAAVVAVLHDVTAALAADRVLVLERGRLVADGLPGDAALHAALEAVFGAAFSIESVHSRGRQRWVALPSL
jgi:iron complex transport system ATP-binding protein